MHTHAHACTDIHYAYLIQRGSRAIVLKVRVIEDDLIAFDQEGMVNTRAKGIQYLSLVSTHGGNGCSIESNRSGSN